MAYNYDEEKDKVRKEILDELNGKNNEKRVEDNQYVSYGMKKKVVNFDIDYEKKDMEEQQNIEPPKKSSVIMFIGCSLLVLVGILLFPVVSDKISEYKIKKENDRIHNDKEEKKVEEIKYEKLTLESSKVKNLYYPVYHINSEKKDTYYTKDKMTIKDFSNNDLLYNSFVKFASIFYEDYKGGYSGKACNSKKLKVNAKYFEIVIKDYMTKDVTIKLTDLVIPSYTPYTSYTGLWKYDDNKYEYVYYGDCNKKSTNILYYDLKDIYAVDNSEKNIELYAYNYIGYAAVDTKNKNYIIYSDSTYTKKVSSGVLTTNNYQNELNSIFSSLDKKSFNKYKYTYTTKNCPYNEYCFISGEWVK